MIQGDYHGEAYPEIVLHLDGDPVDGEVFHGVDLVAGLLGKVEGVFKGMLTLSEDNLQCIFIYSMT